MSSTAGHTSEGSLKPAELTTEELVGQIDAALTRAAMGAGSRADLTASGLAWSKALRDNRAFRELALSADRLRRGFPEEPLFVVHQAQALVDQGLCAAARDLLVPEHPAAPPGSPAWRERLGLLGRAYKQIFLDQGGGAAGLADLNASLAAYGAVFDQDPAEGFWHGGNIAGLLYRARQLGAAEGEGLQRFADQLAQVRDSMTPKPDDYWWRGTAAESELAHGDLAAFAARLKDFVDCPGVTPFALNSLQRQLVELWRLDDNRQWPGGSELLDLLRARVLRTPAADRANAAELRVPTAQAKTATLAPAAKVKLESIFGDAGPLDWIWWRQGLERAASVAAVLAPRGGGMVRKGSGFLVPVKDQGQRRFLLTNAHVVGDSNAAVWDVASARARFEAVDQTQYSVKQLWTSPATALDATLLEIVAPGPGLTPLPLRRELPPIAADQPVAARPRLYIIGYPSGQELSFSFQDNNLVATGPDPARQPQPPVATFVHYRTATLGGSSGSPVFTEDLWRAVALHHAGDWSVADPGGSGQVEVNEGIALDCIAALLLKEAGLEMDFD